MGAQKRSVAENADIVVDISRGGVLNRRNDNRDIKMTEADDLVSSSTATALSSDGKYHADVVDAPVVAKDLHMELTVVTKNGTVGAASKNNIHRELPVASNFWESDMAAQVMAEDSTSSPLKELSAGMSVMSNSLQPERERLLSMTTASKNGGFRKRKKTIHYMKSRVPHSRIPHELPTVDSDEGSDGQDSPDEIDEVPVRGPSQGPRAAATKLKSMIPVGDKLPKAPRNAKELMATRLMEGHFVRCQCRGIQLTGMLRDMGVQCDCRNCRGSVVVSISAFEAHSGSTSHHPSDNIYLENGKNLRDIIGAGQEAADCGDNIYRALKMAIGDVQGVEKRTIACAKCGSSEDGDLIPCNGPRCPLVFHSGCTATVNAQLGDWFCPKCEKMKKARGVVKARRPLSGGMEDARVR